MPSPQKRRPLDPTSGIAALAVQVAPAVPTDVILQGWLLKKRRKKMQGFARRYFTLRTSGLLSYSYQPNDPIRDQILLGNASISSSSKGKDIHIDSGTATFHVKALSREDFHLWMTTIRRFIPSATGEGNEGEPALARRSSLARTATLSRSVGRTQVVLQEMTKTLHDLEATVLALSQEELKRKSNTSKSKKEPGAGSAKDKEGLFGLFHRGKSNHNQSSHHPTPPNSYPDLRSVTDTNSPPPSPPATPQIATLEQVRAYLTDLKIQHAALVNAFPSFDVPSANRSPLQTLSPTMEEPHVLPMSHSRQGSTHYTHDSKRESISTLMSSEQWFDALDDGLGAEEYVLDAETEQDVEGTDAGAPSEDDEESDRESVQRMIDATPTPEEKVMSPYQETDVVRRTILPAPTSGNETSLFAVLKKNVGKDLSTVAFPVSFNEPITLLQRLAEDVEYTDLLAEAVKTTDPIERICFVAAFAVSGYACTRFRSGRKPFNPLLAETFEDIRMKFVAEKVSHYPPIMACHAQGEGWEYWATSGGKNKFWGKSLEIIPTGTTHLQIGEDHYQWQKPSSFMRNLIAGTKYLEHVGPLTIVNTRTGERCELQFKETGFWGASPNVVAGTVFSSSGKVVTTLEGTWHENMTRILEPSHLRVLWRANPFPHHAQQYYGFSTFATTLNEITPDIAKKLPPTDSRFRPDQRALEEGRVDDAEEEKLRVEEMQRERRRRGQDAKPRWFRKVGDGEDAEYVYVGGYWEARAAGWKEKAPAPLW